MDEHSVGGLEDGYIVSSIVRHLQNILRFGTVHFEKDLKSRNSFVYRFCLYSFDTSLSSADLASQMIFVAYADCQHSRFRGHAPSSSMCYFPFIHTIAPNNGACKFALLH